MKRLLALTLALFMVVSLVACASTSTSTTTATAADSSSATDSASESAATADSASETATVPHWTIGFANRDDTDVYLKQVEDAFKALVDQDSTLECYFADAGGDSQTQLGQLDNFNIQGVNAVVLVPQDSSTVVNYVEDWNKQGIPVFCSSQSSDGGDFTFVGASDYDTGLYEGQYAYAHLPQGAKVLYLGGDLGYQTSIDRRQGFVDGLKERIKSDWDGKVLNENGDVEVLSWQCTMYTMEEGMTVTEDWIQTFDNFDAIVCVNDSTALGALEALKGAGINNCMIISIDGVEDALHAVKDGTMACTVMQSYTAQAQALYDAVKVAQNGGTNPAVINPDVILVDISNVDQYLS